MINPYLDYGWVRLKREGDKMGKNKCLYSDCYVPPVMEEVIEELNKKSSLKPNYELINNILKKGTELLPTYN